MREGWSSTALKNVCTVDKAKHSGTTLPYVGLEHIESGTGKFIGSLAPATVKSTTFSFTASHVLYGRLRPYLNKVLLPEFDGHCSSEIFPLRVESSLNRRFLYYWLTWEPVVKEIDSTSTGARMPRANINKLLEFELPLPSLPEQNRIVAILDEAFAGIATVVANTEKNLTNARELFESYLNGVFNQPGEGWVKRPLGDVCKFQGGSQPPKSAFSKEQLDDYVRLIQIRDYKSDKYKVYIPKSLARRFCSADEIMIGRYGPPLFQILRGIEGAYNVALIKAIPREGILSKDYLYYFLRNRNILDYVIHASSRAAGQAGINKATLEPYPIAFPVSLHEQQQIVEKLNLLLQETTRVESNYLQKVEALTELKQSLLQKAFSGELTAGKEVSDVIRNKEEVA